jgi:hypothetical protein
MAIDKATRKKMEEKVYGTFDRLDPTKVNSNKYKALFSKMSDAQFDKFFKDLFADDDQYLVLDVVDYERNLLIEHVEDAAKYLGVPLFEKVAMPWVNKDRNNPVITKFAVPVGFIHLKRVQQILSKKNTTSTDVSSRSALTGQVVGKDKNARDSDTENFALVTINAHDTLREFMGPRADDMVMKNEMYSQIAQKGFVSLESLTNNVENKVTLNALDVHLIGMGLKSDIITDGLIVKKTINE